MSTVANVKELKAKKDLNKDENEEKKFNADAFWKALDKEQKYSTPGDKVYIIGQAKRAIGIDLTDTTPSLPSPVGKIDNHMTIYYRSSSKKQFTNNDIEIIKKSIIEWKKSKQIENVSYTLEPGHGRSANINGNLSDLCLYVRAKCKESVCSDEQAPPHVGILTRDYRN